MIPGVTSSKVEHFVSQPGFGFGIWVIGSVSTINLRSDHLSATDGTTMAMLSFSNSDPSASKNVYYSNDYANTWTVVPGTPPVTINAIQYLDGKWCALTNEGIIRYSTDITANWSTWSTGGTTGKANCVYVSFNADAASKWAIGSYESVQVYYSTSINGTYSTRSVGANIETLYCGYLNSQPVWVMGRPNGTLESSSLGGNLATSSTLTSGSGVNNACRSILWTPGLWIMGGELGNLYTSPDSGSDFTWTLRASGLDATHDVGSLAYINNTYYAGGYPTGPTAGTPVQGQISSSTDGVTWTKIRTSSTNIIGGYARGIVKINGAAKFAIHSNAAGGTPEANTSSVLSHNYAKR